MVKMAKTKMVMVVMLVVLVSWQNYREKSRSQSLTFLHIREKHGFHFLIRKLRVSTERMRHSIKLIGYINLIILFHFAPSRSLQDKYFFCYDFLRFFCEKFELNFFRFFMILCRINKGVYLCLFGHANTRKHVYEHSCLSVRVFLSILAHLAHLAQFFFLISNVINE